MTESDEGVILILLLGASYFLVPLTAVILWHIATSGVFP
jgi:hypothetical protein